MKRIALLAVVLMFSAVIAHAQTPAIASPEEQNRIKPLIQAETKAREALNAKVVALPEAKAYNDAQKALETALEAFKQSASYKGAEETLKQASEALNKAAEALPENTAWKLAGAKALDTAYQIQAEHKLSSREFKPEVNTQGNLVFTKLVLPKP